jgi:hypothetical protein
MLRVITAVPRDNETNTVSWTVDVPDEGDDVVWLRYLHRGDGWRGGEVMNQPVLFVDGDEVTILGGETELNVPDQLITKGHPMASKVWTLDGHETTNLKQIHLTAGAHALRLENLHKEIRYDALALTTDPAWQPPDGRHKQH